MPWQLIFRAVFVEPWPWWVAGPAVGLLVPFLYWFFNTPLGVSTGYLDLVGVIRLPCRWRRAKTKVLEPAARRRLFLVAGMVCGGLLSRLASGAAPVLSTAAFTGPGVPAGCLTSLHLFAGGALLGLGARLAGGCTSGHGIHGVSRFHLSSIAVTFLFIVFAFVSANFLGFFCAGSGP